jgi:glucosamine-6-phosphate deaminase
MIDLAVSERKLMKMIKVENYKEMSEAAAGLIAAQVIIKNNCTLGLATGSSAEGIYGCLARDYALKKLDFSQVRTINLDEYLGLPANDAHTYSAFMQRNLFSKINIQPENAQIPNSMPEDAQAECRRYDAVIEQWGGVDLQLLGIGHNGHIGFNEPGDCFYRNTHVVELAKDTIKANSRFFASEDAVPKRSITMGLGAIMNARKILLVASGKNKAEALHKAFYGDITPKLPASILQLHWDVTVIADKQAWSYM